MGEKILKIILRYEKVGRLAVTQTKNCDNYVNREFYMQCEHTVRCRAFVRCMLKEHTVS
jgi:hypothetical protein